MNNQQLRQTPSKIVQEKRNLKQETDYSKQKFFDQEFENQVLKEDSIMTNQRLMMCDSRADSFLRENSSLHLDVDKLTKIAKQKKTEADLWKSKYETQMQQIIQIKANYEQEIRSLSNETQVLIARIEQLEFDKQRQILDHKSAVETQNSKDLEIIKRNQSQYSEAIEQQMRKLRQQLEEQESELQGLHQKLLRQKTEDDREKERLLKENESLRSRINQIEIEKQRELEELNDGLNRFTLEQIENLKQEFSGHNDIMEGEIQKLKGLLEIKNAEIETLIQQNARNKLVSEEQMNSLKDEAMLLKQRMLEQERQARASLELLQQDLNYLSERNLNDLKVNYESMIHNFEKELNDLKTISKKKDLEIQAQMNEKNQMKINFDIIMTETRREIEETKLMAIENVKEKNNEIEELNEMAKKNVSLLHEQNDNLKGQVEFLQGEVHQLKEHLLVKGNELESHIQQHSLQKRGVDDENRKLRFEVDKMRSDFLQYENQKHLENEELRQRNQKLEILFREKMKQLEIQNEQSQLEIKRFKEFLDVKNQEYDNLLCQKQLGEKDLKRTREEIEIMKNRLLQGERDKFLQFEDIKRKLEDSNAYQINNLKAAFNTQIQVLNDENLQLKQALEQKRHDLQDLLEKYEGLRTGDSIQMSPELVTSRNIYDIYLKSRYKFTNEKVKEQ